MRARVCVCRLAALFFVFGAGRCDLRRAFSSHGTSAGPRLCWSVQCRAERPFWQDIECAWRFLPTGTARGAPMCIMSQPSRVRVPFASGFPFRVPHPPPAHPAPKRKPSPAHIAAQAHRSNHARHVPQPRPSVSLVLSPDPTGHPPTTHPKPHIFPAQPTRGYGLTAALATYGFRRYVVLRT